ncbi:peptidoglycan-binding protein [Streptomyces europaeiscabiei]|uniref:Peptidoglycan-binding protein n=1 Tax=Streptomyces europaeiscabiei TaxID=146819 RepID=A0ABU4NAF9_9ACTN|nr:peptidoglycan-binding protein [Streptomyces europaeiscabiei]MDX3550990.1 peptidoglycan-binding protein [Streptomyces europaeiscabiei]MDX3698450.1 peptidoglycan-binding protein [Streptomyces europaeiscabiei]
MGTIWIPGAERLGDGSIGGDMDTPGNPPRVTWHSTESGAGDAAFNAVATYLIKIGAEPHVLYDPTTDRLGQFGPLSASARALRNDGATRTNRTGKVNVQIEVLARAATPFTGYWKPGPNFRALMAAIRSWGVPDVFPLPLAARYGAGVRTRSVWLGTAGHYGHCNVPGNDHWDPGAISPAALFAAAPTGTKPSEPKPAPKLEPFPGTAWFKRSPRSAIVTAMGKRLVAEGYRGYAEGPGPQWTEADRKAYAWWQRKCGYSGVSADGWPGEATWAKLRVPNV